jgi:hypothetical protein
LARPKMYDWVLSVSFTEEQSKYIERRAVREGVALAEVVRKALDRERMLAADNDELRAVSS